MVSRIIITCFSLFTELCDYCTVLIQPNLKFLHELLGWEIETRAIESLGRSMDNSEILQRYSWPSLCRDLVSDFAGTECVR